MHMIKVLLRIQFKLTIRYLSRRILFVYLVYYVWYSNILFSTSKQIN